MALPQIVWDRKPPSTRMSVPVTNELALLAARNTHAPMSSCDSPKRFIGVCPQMDFVRAVGEPSSLNEIPHGDRKPMATTAAFGPVTRTRSSRISGSGSPWSTRGVVGVAARQRLGHRRDLHAALDDYIAEEIGHDQWILDDIAAAGGDSMRASPALSADADAARGCGTPAQTRRMRRRTLRCRDD